MQENNLILTARDAEQLKLKFAGLSDKSNVEFQSLDVSSHEQIESFAAQCPAVSGLIYCPGLASAVPARHIRANHLQPLMDVNFTGAVLLTGALLRLKKISNGASLVFLSSEAVRVPYFGSALYSASKAALEAYALALANELQPKKIRVNVVSPAFVETGMMNDAARQMSADFIDQMRKMHPEAFGNASELAEIIAFLLSKRSQLINGQIIKTGRFNINIPAL